MCKFLCGIKWFFAENWLRTENMTSSTKKEVFMKVHLQVLEINNDIAKVKVAIKDKQ